MRIMMMEEDGEVYNSKCMQYEEDILYASTLYTHHLT
jgi:hypothetical protein